MKAIIIAGCGGGSDIYGALSLFFELNKNCTKTETNIILVNYSLMDPKEQSIQKYITHVTDNLAVVNCIDTIDVDQNPKYSELKLSKILSRKIYILTNYPTCREIVTSYQTIMKMEEVDVVDALYLVDGGCDVILSGNEEGGLGSPVEDMMHLKAVTGLNNVLNKIVLAIGLNIEIGDGVLQSSLDKRINELEEKKIMLDKKLLNYNDECVKKYCDCVLQPKPLTSTVQNLIVCAILGHRGYYVPEHLKYKIEENVICLMDQTCTLYHFDLKRLAESVIYLDIIGPDQDSDEVDELIEKFIETRVCKP